MSTRPSEGFGYVALLVAFFIGCSCFGEHKVKRSPNAEVYRLESEIRRLERENYELEREVIQLRRERR